MRVSGTSSDLVLDASVALAALLLEPLHRQALSVILRATAEGSRCLCPDSFDVECAAGITRAIRRGRVERESGARAWAQLVALPLERHPCRVLGGDALRIAAICGISAYAAMYVALSSIEGLSLMTADARLVRALAGTEHPTLLLDEVPLG
jgi:predicted nucleic acid-binding protein